jgi:hypothetical protein
VAGYGSFGHCQRRWSTTSIPLSTAKVRYKYGEKRPFLADRTGRQRQIDSSV